MMEILIVLGLMFHTLHSVHVHCFDSVICFCPVFMLDKVGTYTCVSANNDFHIKKYVCTCRNVCV